MKDTTNHEESRQLQLQLEFEDYSQEVELETRDNVRVQSDLTMSENGRDDKQNTEGLLKKILESDNLNLAYKKIKANKGSHGVDGMTVNELLQYLKQNGEELKKSILNGTYVPIKKDYGKKQ